MSSDPAPETPVELTIEADHSGKRLDVLLAAQFPQYSRAYLRKAIDAGGLSVDGKPAKASHRARPGERIAFHLPDLPREGPQPEAIPLEILYEDEHLAAINKPAGMVVHPAKGHWSGTLAAAAAHHFGQLSSVGGPTRPGIVHRLDRDTSGVIVLAKSDVAHTALAKQFAARTTEKQYWALVIHPPQLDADVIDRPIGPHPQQREKMAILADHPASRAAETFYEVGQRLGRFAQLRVAPKTGRTHQIRVHLASIGCPVLCDRLYGGRAELTADEAAGGAAGGHVLLARQALHAERLRIRHPLGNHALEFTAPLPADLAATLAALQAAAG